MKHLTPSLGRYLRAIYDTREERRVVRVRDLAERLNVKDPSVVKALKKLNERGLIVYEKHGFIDLSPGGLTAARQLARTGDALQSALFSLGVEDRVARKAAEGIAPELSEDSAEKLDRALRPAELEEHDDASPTVPDSRFRLKMLPCSQPRRRTYLHLYRESDPPKSVRPSLFAIRLSKLKLGQKGMVARILLSSETGAPERRLLELGLARGTVVEVKQADSSTLRIMFGMRGPEVSISREEAEAVIVDQI